MTDQLSALTTIFTEFYYWVTVVLMFLIHVGFCMYEVGASRYKHHQHTLMKNTMLIPLVTITWFFFGWWIYWAFPTGPGFAPSIMNESAALITDESAFSATWYVATSDLMAVNLNDHISGVFWAQNTPLMWSFKFTAIKSLVATYQVALNADSSVINAALSFIIDGAKPGPVGNAQYIHQPKKNQVIVTKGINIVFFINVCW